MSIQKSSTFGRSILSPILVILVSGSLCLAVIDKENRPAYFDIVKIAVGYAFGAMNVQRTSNDSDNLDDPDGTQTPEKENSKECG